VKAAALGVLMLFAATLTQARVVRLEIVER